MPNVRKRKPSCRGSLSLPSIVADWLLPSPPGPVVWSLTASPWTYSAARACRWAGSFRWRSRYNWGHGTDSWPASLPSFPISFCTTCPPISWCMRSKPLWWDTAPAAALQALLGNAAHGLTVFAFLLGLSAGHWTPPVPLLAVGIKNLLNGLLDVTLADLLSGSPKVMRFLGGSVTPQPLRFHLSRGSYWPPPCRF